LDSAKDTPNLPKLFESVIYILNLIEKLVECLGDTVDITPNTPYRRLNAGNK